MTMEKIDELIRKLFGDKDKKPRTFELDDDSCKGLSGDQLHFLTSRSIPFLKHWPIECLATNPQACMFHFFGYVYFMYITVIMTVVVFFYQT